MARLNNSNRETLTEDAALFLHFFLRYCFSSHELTIQQHCLNSQSSLGFRTSDVCKNNFQTGQRLAGPIHADVAKQAALNRIEF